jgi:hypothetical protein
MMKYAAKVMGWLDMAHQDASQGGKLLRYQCVPPHAL